MFLDTSGLFALLSDKDPQQRRAQELFDANSGFLTANYVLAELHALALVRRIPRRMVLGYSRKLLEQSDLELTWVGKDLHTGALTLLESRADKTYSLCDAVSFLVMRAQGETEALTTDRHFEQEGFVRLLPA
ncbi:MAG: PIN domain-containing protein [Planctomycetota bacterium]|nr:PIN domain-containing protein [Planctomycetota bacterium]